MADYERLTEQILELMYDYDPYEFDDTEAFRCCIGSFSRSATGDVTAGASRAWTTPAAAGSRSSSGSFRSATTTSTSIRTSATT